MSGRSVFLLSVLIAGVAAADPAGRVFAPAADDAFVLSTAPDTTHPDWGLRSGADASGVYRTFARFPLPRSGEIVSATLELGFASSASSSQIIDFVPDDAWSQQTLTWNDQPGVAERIGTSERATDGSVSVDVTELARREQSLDGWLGLRIAGATETPSSSGAVWWPSREGDGPGIHLDLVVTPAPELRRGDVVMLATDGFFRGVVAIDPSERVLRGIAPIRFVEPLGGLGVDPRNGDLIGSDGSGLVRIDRETGSPVSVADFAARWAPYRALALTSDGHVYSTDGNGGVVRFELDSGARETLVPGDGLCPPVAMALAGNSLFTDDWCGQLLRIDVDTHAQSVVATGGPLYEPEGIAVEASGTILVADRTQDYGWSGRIVRIDPASGTQSVVTELPFAPGAIAVGPNGAIWVASKWSDGLFEGVFGRVDPQLGTFTELFRNSPEDPSGIAIDADGAPLVAYTRGYNDAYIVRFDPVTGSSTTIASPPGPPYSHDPEGAHFHLFVDAQRQLLAVTDDRVIRIDPATGVQTLIARIESAGCAPNPICLTSDVALAPDGRIVLLREVLAVGAYPRLVWIDPGTGDVAVQEVDWSLSRTDRLAIESSGTILLNHHYFWDAWIARYDPLTGQASTAFDLGELVARIDDMALDAEGMLFVADTESSEILRVDRATGVAAHVGASPTPGRLIVDAFGSVISWNTRGCWPCQEKLSILDPATGSLTTLATDSEVWANRTLAVVEPECADHLDNDQDGLVDLADPACATPHGTRENRRRPLCGVGVELAPLLAFGARLGVGRTRRRAP